jgi:hypothetical protein
MIKALRVCLVLGLLTLAPRLASAQITYGATIPSACITGIGSLFFLTSTQQVHYCNASGVWTPFSTGGAALPSGLIGFVISGTCPAGTTEVAALLGKTLVLTTAASGNVGTTGGLDTVTPTGTIAWPAGVPVFTGSALVAHSHELPFQNVNATTVRNIAAATFGTGTSRAAIGIVGGTGTANTTSAAVALTQSVTAGTPVGTIAWPGGVPTFTGANLDNRSAFTRAIPCAIN